MNERPLDLVEFLKLVIDALTSAGVDYMIGGAIAAWAWGEPRATQDLDLVVNIPMDSVVALANELKKRDMPVPPEIILDALLENRTDLPVNVIHMYSGLKADLFPVRAEDELRQVVLPALLRTEHPPHLVDSFVPSGEQPLEVQLRRRRQVATRQPLHREGVEVGLHPR